MDLSIRAIHEKAINSIEDGGEILFTNEKNIYVTKSNGEKVKFTDVIFVKNTEELNLIPLEHRFLNKIYVIENTYSLFIWNGVKFSQVSGSGGSNSTYDLHFTKEPFNVEYTYNDKNKVIREVYTGSIEKIVDYTYDPITENVVTKKVTRSGNVYTANYEYDSFGNIIKVIDDGTDILYYNGLIRPFKYTITLKYNLNNNVIKEIYTGDITREIAYVYNNNEIITKKIVTDSNGQVFISDYIYDETTGNIISSSQSGEELFIVDGNLSKDFINNLEKNDLHHNTEVLNALGETTTGNLIYKGNEVGNQFSLNNKNVVEKFSEVNGQLLYNNSPIIGSGGGSGGSSSLTKQLEFTNIIATELSPSTYSINFETPSNYLVNSLNILKFVSSTNTSIINKNFNSLFFGYNKFIQVVDQSLVLSNIRTIKFVENLELIPGIKLFISTEEINLNEYKYFKVGEN